MEKYERLTDEQLISELRSGETGVMDFIMVKYKSMVRKKARAMYLLGGENEDLIQEGKWNFPAVHFLHAPAQKSPHISPPPVFLLRGNGNNIKGWK